MRIKKTISLLSLALALAGGLGKVASAQEAAPKRDAAQQRSRTVTQTGSATTATAKTTATPAVTTTTTPSTAAASEKSETDTTTTTVKPTSAGLSDETLANRREQPSEGVAEITPYYNNFFTTYRIGPEDVISIRVFGQDRYSVLATTVPPDGVISHPLIPEGVRVVGKTREQVQAELTKRLDEYIIDPKVSVSIDKSLSYRYIVVGAVAQPGVRLMGRRLTAYQAIMEAGGVTNLADKKKVYVLRSSANGTLGSTVINIAAIERGKIPDTFYLAPGDQVFVPNNKFKAGVDQVLKYLPVLTFARIFTGGF